MGWPRSRCHASSRSVAPSVAASAARHPASQPRMSLSTELRVDLKLSSADAIYLDDEGTEHIVEWVTRQDDDSCAISPRSPPRRA